MRSMAVDTRTYFTHTFVCAFSVMTSSYPSLPPSLGNTYRRFPLLVFCGVRLVALLHAGLLCHALFIPIPPVVALKKDTSVDYSTRLTRATLTII